MTAVQNTSLENKRFYTDYRNQQSSKSQNTLILVYKWILIAFIVISTILIFVFMDKSIFPAKMLKSEDSKQPLEFLFNFQNTQLRQKNATVILRFSPLIFVLIYATVKNFINIENQKEKINKYIYFYVLYFALAIISVLLLFLFIDNKVTLNLRLIQKH
ncbi:MSC_0624 family F1-like ATPase-associated membrane protein [Mycoplasmopsis felifaucium]|uniref:MSC_0624 family F1-like ATPase-associated membrane protein n=1 Tax=Mycoplasmopsis felifaucium TaxID=35768 RepID=UPI0004852EA9|nr:hypothetical protein [Mycoplasmopsis felifaucium]